MSHAPGERGCSCHSTLKDLATRLRNLETQQNFIATAQHQVQRINLGPMAGAHAGGFGHLLTDANGNTTELLPSVDSFNNGPLSTASTTNVSLSSSPAVSVVLPATGDIEITADAYVGTHATDTVTASITARDVTAAGLLINVGDIAAVSSGGIAGSSGNVQSTRRWSLWASGAFTLVPVHTVAFSMQHRSSSGADNVLKAQPLWERGKGRRRP